MLCEKRPTERRTAALVSIAFYKGTIGPAAAIKDRTSLGPYIVNCYNMGKGGSRDRDYPRDLIGNGRKPAGAQRG